MKTKILSFILFAILLIFTSCGDGTTNSGNSDINDNPQLDGDIDDNTQFEDEKTEDNCVYCDDEKIDNSCINGNECYAGGKVISLGENYQAFDAMNGTRFNTDYDQGKIDSLNTYKTRYEKYVNGLINDFSDEFKTKYSIDNINFRTFEYGRNNNDLVDPSDAIFDSEIEQLNDVCAPVIKEITKNIGISGNDEYYNDLDKTIFELYYRALANEVYNYANSGTNTYTDEKNNIQYRLSYANNIAGTDYKIYNQDGTIHPEVLQRFDQMITKAADRLNIDVNELRKFVNLSFTPTTLKGMHDCIETKIDHAYNKDGTNTACPTSEMVDVIESVQVSEMTPIAQAKLNKSIFSQDFGRELC